MIGNVEGGLISSTPLMSCKCKEDDCESVEAKMMDVLRIFVDRSWLRQIPGQIDFSRLFEY